MQKMYLFFLLILFIHTIEPMDKTTVHFPDEKQRVYQQVLKWPFLFPPALDPPNIETFSQQFENAVEGKVRLEFLCNFINTYPNDKNEIVQTIAPFLTEIERQIFLLHLADSL